MYDMIVVNLLGVREIVLLCFRIRTNLTEYMCKSIEILLRDCNVINLIS